MALIPNIGPGGNFGGFTAAPRLPKPADKGAIQPVHADVVKQLDNAMPDWREILQRQSETPLGKYGTLADNAQADMLRSRAQNPQADGVDNNGSPFSTNRDLFTNQAINQVAGENDIKRLTDIPNPYGPPAQDPGQDAQDNPGVNLRGQFQNTATQALGAMATGPEKANAVRKVRFYGR